MPRPADFWTRRRRAVAEEVAVDEARAEAAPEAPDAPGPEGETEAETLARLGLPDPEAVGPDDVAAFMARTVPAALRRRAMRALFAGHPGLSTPDGLQDYDLDFRTSALAERPLRQVWDPVIRAAETALAQADTAALAQADTAASPTEEPGAAVPEPVAPAEPVPAPEVELDPGTSRRMAFRFAPEANL